MKKFVFVFCLLSLSVAAVGQMSNGRFGNEWIDFNQQYFKILVAQDGVYRIPFQALAAQGVDVSESSNIHLYHFGELVPVHVGEDYIEFFGRKNRGELDQFLYKNGKADMLNPEYSLFTDTSAYFLAVASSEDAPGKRFTVVENDLTNLPAKEEWYWGERLSNVNTNNIFVQNDLGDYNESVFQRGEGFSSGLSPSRTFTFKPDNIHTGALDSARFELRFVTRGLAWHALEINLNTQKIISDSIPGHQLQNISFGKLAPELLIEEKVTVQRASTEGADQYAIGVAKLTYPRKFNFNNSSGFHFNLIGDGSPKYLEIENFKADGAEPILYDLTTSTRKITRLENGKVLIKIEAFTGDREFYLVNSASGVTLVNNLVNKNFANYNNLDGDYIIITSRKLRADGQGNDLPQEYAEYRRSTGFNPVILEVEDLYDAFAYGVQRHSLAVRNLAHFAKANWTNPRYILLLGKGRVFNDIRGYNAATDAIFFVPTFGSPGADNLLVASNDSQVPVIPVGRIAATKPADIQLYLNKLRDYEDPVSQSAEDRAWRKQVIHLGGGKTSGEQFSIEGNMDAMNNILSNNAFGADIYTYYKRSNDATQRLESEKINELLQQGVGVITFFGHGGPTIIDISIGDPATYTNNRKYPVMFALGCSSGDLHFNGTSYSENFVLQPNRAGIAFVGTSAEGFIGSLGSFQQSLYTRLGGEFYGKGLGDAMQQTIQQYDNATSNQDIRMLIQQYTFHGDPAIVISPYAAPDYVVDRRSIQFNPSLANVQQDSLDINLQVLNVGKNIRDSLTLEIVREFPDGTTSTLLDTIPTPAYRSDALSYRFPVGGTNAAGYNRFYIQLDKENAFEELPTPEAEFNNELTDDSGNKGIQLYIFDEGIAPIEPRPFAIVNAQSLKLLASTANVFESEKRYLMQIDTTAQFNSPLRRDTAFVTRGGLLTWQPQIQFKDSTAYYWRVAPDSIVGLNYNWTTSSFTYIPNSSPGWRQGHYFQFLDNDFSSLELPGGTRQLQFEENPSYLDFRIFTYSGGGYFDYATVNNITNQYTFGIGGGGVTICVFDGVSGDPWENEYISRSNPGKFGSVVESWPGQAWTIFPYSTRTPEARKKVIDFLNDTIPDGHYVFLYTIQHLTTTYEPEEWAQDTMFDKTLMDVLAENGATQIQQAAAEGARPYAIFYRKGMSTPLFFEELAVSVNDTVSRSIIVPGFKDQGGMVAQRIGPARNWERLRQQFEQIEDADQYAVNVYGIRNDGAKVLLIETYTGRDTSLNQIKAGDFPFLELAFNARDSANRSPAQFGYWQVLYEGLPEAALNPLTSDFQFKRDTLQEGEMLELDINIANVSRYDMDSLLVKFSIISSDNRVRIDTMRLQPLLQQDTLVAHFRYPTKGLRGKQQLIVEVNPDEDQPELSHFNNVGSLEFFVVGDMRNPLVDVMFDGVRIMNGDLVAARPQIVATLRDENRYLPLIDTASLRISLRYPDDSPTADPRRIPADSLNFEFKTTDKGTTATIHYTPEFTQDGTYMLLINGRDASGNLTGSIDFQVEFEVITDSKISNVLNYPNPFSTATQFVYTLSGVEAPSHYIIQIMTVSGRIVRELTELDLGSLRIGTHRTDYAWDGTDMYGDRLANGVYLYRMVVKDRDSNNYERYDNGTDRFFRNNMGKLVILR